MAVYEVVCTNIGSVYSGNSLILAKDKFKSYVADSKSSYGRASGEDVILFERGEIRDEFIGALSQSREEQ